jgi:energy-coupling factor transporter ATP-binding protein EcfA2
MVATTVEDVARSRGDAVRWAVETHGLTKRFGENVAVDAVELLVPRGCAFGYLGPNGAGKTTLIRVLLGGYEQIEFCRLRSPTTKSCPVGPLNCPRRGGSGHENDRSRHACARYGFPQSGANRQVGCHR